MKLTKISLIAAMLIGSSAFAIENTKVSGDAKLYYGTVDNLLYDYFDKAGSYGDMGLHLDLTTDLTKGVSAGVGMQIVTTLGLENNLVDNTWSGAHGVGTATGSTTAVFDGIQVDTATWTDEAWLAATAFKTTLKIGRQALDTPLTFSETWGVDKNTFEAMVLINQSFAGTTLVAAYVGKSNGSADEEAKTLDNGGADFIGTHAEAGYVTGGGEFSTFGTDGAYALAAVNNSWKPLTAQAWFYNMSYLAKAYWLQTDLNLDSVLAGVQVASTELQKGNALGLENTKDTSMYSVMLGYKVDTLTLKTAYSSVGDEGVLGMANAATGAYHSGLETNVATLGGESKLYTEMWSTFGVVSAPGANSWSITAESTTASDVDLFVGLYKSSNTKEDTNMREFTLSASQSFGPLDAAVAIIFYDANADDVNTESSNIQAFFDYSF